MTKFIIKNRSLMLIVLLSFSAIATLAGCSTPQERAGVSPIPFNSPTPSEQRSYGGSF